jgi:hypothetical protein
VAWKANNDQNIALEVIAKLGQNNVTENSEAIYKYTMLCTKFWSRDVIDDYNSDYANFRHHQMRQTLRSTEFSKCIDKTGHDF